MRAGRRSSAVVRSRGTSIDTVPFAMLPDAGVLALLASSLLALTAIVKRMPWM